MITPNWVKELTKIDDEDLFIDERRLKKALKFYETKKNVPRFAKDIKSEVDEGFAEDPDEPIYHRFPRWFSESEEFSGSLVNICKSNVGSEDYMNIWYMMDIALTCLITGKVYSLNAMEGEYEDEAYQVFIALMKHIANDYNNFSKNFSVTNNLSEANKYFFGTENTNEVKKLFESTEEKIYIYYGTEENGYEIQKYETKNLTKDLGDILADTDLSKKEINDLINEFTENISNDGVYYISTYNSHGYDIFIGVAKKSQTKTLSDILKSLRKEFKEMF